MSQTYIFSALYFPLKVSHDHSKIYRTYKLDSNGAHIIFVLVTAIFAGI